MWERQCVSGAAGMVRHCHGIHGTLAGVRGRACKAKCAAKPACLPAMCACHACSTVLSALPLPLHKVINGRESMGGGDDALGWSILREERFRCKSKKHVQKALAGG